MRSNKIYIPKYLSKKSNNTKHSRQHIYKIIYNILYYGLYGLPVIDSTINLSDKIINNESIFEGIPLLRIVREGRTLVLNDKIIMIWRTEKLNQFVDKSFYKTNTYVFSYDLFKDINAIFSIKYKDKVDFQFYIQDKSLLDVIKKVIPSYSTIAFCIDKKPVVGYYDSVNINTSGYFTQEEYSDYTVLSSCLSLSELIEKNIEDEQDEFNTENKVSIDYIITSDNVRAKLPILDFSYARDNALGLWDVYWTDDGVPDDNWYRIAEIDEECEALDPWNCIQYDSSVSIDFGTSSTVAAVRENNGEIRLLRIGGDLNSPSTIKDYENPTALEFSDYNELLIPWKNEPWRPHISWDNIKCSHQAKNELLTGTLSRCGLKNIKIWSRIYSEDRPLRLQDEQGFPFELFPLNIEYEDGIGNFNERSVDPIELYAFFIGIFLNNQSVFSGRIYCNYTITFPIKFTIQERRRILQGFYRGLLRSMPLSLVSSAKWKEKFPFKLEEHASEPTAFAASVLPYLGIQPTDSGTPFGVFDFGGGTVDYAFGLYRTANNEEIEVDGWENVLDIFDVSGDENAGGEQILDLITYNIIKLNSNQVFPTNNENKYTPFLCPLNIIPFPGSELIFSEGYIAHSNTVNLRERLRCFWEDGAICHDENGCITVNLKLNSGDEVNIDFKIDEDLLTNIVKNKIKKCVFSFFSMYNQSIKKYSCNKTPLHVLLAGNSCRSPFVRQVFDDFINAEFNEEEKDNIKIHYEMVDANSSEKYKKNEESYQTGCELTPTLKTGVALGLLNLLPGESTGVVERKKTDDAPFLFSVGVFKNNILSPILYRNSEYDNWIVFGKVFKSGYLLFGYSSSPLACDLNVCRTECREHKVNFGKENFGKLIYIKAISPRSICMALESKDSSEKIDESTLITFELL